MPHPQGNERLVQLWVWCTAAYLALTMADMLVTLPYTSLTHMLAGIAIFVATLYVWAVAKSFLHALKVVVT